MPGKTESSATDERIRLNFVVNRQIKDRIEHLQDVSGATSLTEVVRRALAVYEEVLKIREEGGQLVIETGGERELLRIL
jgi:hypothetical protein